MASINTDSEKLQPRRRPRRTTIPRLSCRLFCCSCLQGKERDPLQEQEKINGGPHNPHMDQQGSGEKEAIQITVEDLGIVNTSFSLFEEDPLTPRSSMVRSASSVSACPRALKKKRLKPLSSLPIQPQSEQAITSTSGEDDEEEEEDPLLFESGTASTPVSGSLLTPPVINLIPPTPSDVVDDDQFFDINSEESVTHTSGSEGSFAAGDQESYEEKMESVEPEESKEGFSKNQVGADSAAKPEEGISDPFGEEKEAVPTKEGDKEKSKPRFIRNAYQVAPLPEYPQKSESNSDNISTNSHLKQNSDILGNVLLLEDRRKDQYQFNLCVFSSSIVRHLALLSRLEAVTLAPTTPKALLFTGCIFNSDRNFKKKETVWFNEQLTSSSCFQWQLLSSSINVTFP